MTNSNTQEPPLNETPSGDSSSFLENPTAISDTNNSSSSSRDTAASSQCTQCKKPETDPEKPFKPCSKCQTERYCSRDCQKSAWKLHKKVCGEKAQAYAATANLRMDAPRPVKKEGFRGGKSFPACNGFFSFLSLGLGTKSLGENGEKFVGQCI